MKTVFLLVFCLISCQRIPFYSSSHRCENPVEELRWLNDLIANVRSYAARGGWEMHQARYERQEVFVLYLIVPHASQSTFVLYNHYGKEIYRAPVSENKVLPKLQEDRLLAGVAGSHNLH
ncbi:hypothetical protein [Larkinella humicola]|uniref:Uncharacterized protein n=1 Tax=Larkinella humicola TaxID=2607654 RepID=A0A5N1J8G1_9BACT|nr:hypothetical protein [Larkinella humicola]KAA9341100.1 hypothetical protein F0P93_30110 [Larkinella humicola]